MLQFQTDTREQLACLEPLALLLGKHGLLNHLRLYRYSSEPLKPEPDIAIDLVLYLGGAA